MKLAWQLAMSGLLLAAIGAIISLLREVWK